MLALQSAAVAAFWSFTACAVYAYVGYPLVVWALARAFGSEPTPPEAQTDDVPTLSVLIAAHNEQYVIEHRIQNALAMDYPRQKLELVIASDGSTDHTVRIVQEYADRGVRLLSYPQRRGKAAVLNSSIPQLRGDIVLLSDANTFTDPAAARKLVRWFKDPSIGMVCGRLLLVDLQTGRNADGLYWKYETFLKKCENRLGALLGSNGALYAIRRDLFAPIPQDTIVDDFVIPLLARQRTGSQLIYDRDAIGTEETAMDVAAEFGRRARIGAGGFQAIGMLWRLLDPRRGWLAFTFLSHKILRWICPFALIGMLVSNLMLAQRPLYAVALIVQLAFYGMSLAMIVLPRRLDRIRLLRLAPLFTGMNLALLVGFWRWLRGTQGGAWTRTTRAHSPAGAVAMVSSV